MIIFKCLSKFWIQKIVDNALIHTENILGLDYLTTVSEKSSLWKITYQQIHFHVFVVKTKTVVLIEQQLMFSCQMILTSYNTSQWHTHCFAWVSWVRYIPKFKKKKLSSSSILGFEFSASTMTFLNMYLLAAQDILCTMTCLLCIHFFIYCFLKLCKKIRFTYLQWQLFTCDYNFLRFYVPKFCGALGTKYP